MGCLNYKLYPQNLHALLAGAQHKTPPPFSCAEQMKASTGVSEGLELQWKPRRYVMLLHGRSRIAASQYNQVSSSGSSWGSVRYAMLSFTPQVVRALVCLLRRLHRCRMAGMLLGILAALCGLRVSEPQWIRS